MNCLLVVDIGVAIIVVSHKLHVFGGSVNGQRVSTPHVR